jgi:hypothetical protein
MGLSLALGTFLGAAGGGGAPPLSTFDFAPATPTLIKDTLLGGNWSSVNSGTYSGGTTLPVAAPGGQTTGAGLNVPSGSNVVGAIRSVNLGADAFALNDAHIYGFWVYLDIDPASGQRFDLRFITETSPTTPANYKTCSWSRATNAIRKGWNYFVVKGGEDGTLSPHGAWTTTGTVASTATINRIELRVTSTSTASAYNVYWTKVQRFAGPIAKPTVCFTTDGAQYAGQQTYAVPYAAARGIRPTLSVGSDALSLYVAEYAALKAAGWRFMPQDKSHLDATLNPTQYGLDLAGCIAAMQSGGFVRSPEDIRVSSMPYSAANDATRAQAYAQNVRWQREAVLPGVSVTPIGPGMGYTVPQLSMDTALQTLPVMKARIDYAIAYGLSVCFHWHDIVAGGDGTTITGNVSNTYANDLAALMDYAVAKSVSDGLIITSPAQWLKSALVLLAA